MYSSGIRVYLLDNYNLLDFIVLSLYLASYMLRFLVDRWIKDVDRWIKHVDRWIKQADRHYNGTERAREALVTRNYTEYDHMKQEIFYDSLHSSHSYFMKARTCRPCAACRVVKVKGQGHQGQKCVVHSRHPRQRRNGMCSLQITSCSSR